jgi:hypothetical protein
MLAGGSIIIWLAGKIKTHFRRHYRRIQPKIEVYKKKKDTIKKISA